MAVRARHVFRWDLDKTYLRTEFNTWRGLVRSALETASDKQAFPGAAALLRSLRQSAQHRICIISGSPAQMRRVLAAKLALDGIEFDEFVLKDNLRNLTRLRFRALRSQVPYKLPALLESRSGIIGAPPETLFGDDAEADAIVYSLYADILAGRVKRHDLARVMEAARAYPDQAERTLALYDRVKREEAVQRILIHLEERSPTGHFEQFGRRLVPIYNYFQASLVLYADGLLTAPQILFVAREMLEAPEYELWTLANSLQDLLRRGRISPGEVERLAGELEAADAGAGEGPRPRPREIALALSDRLRQLGGSPPPPLPEESPALDYVSLVDAEYQKRQSRRRRGDPAHLRRV